MTANTNSSGAPILPLPKPENVPSDIPVSSPVEAGVPEDTLNASHSGISPGDVKRQVERHRKEHWANLEPKLRAFAIAYVELLCPRKAAKKVGIDPRKGFRTLRDPLVSALVSDLQEEIAQFTVVNERFIQHRLLEMLPKLAGEEEVPIVLGNGAVFEAKKFFPAEYQSALRALGDSLKREHGTHIHVSGEVEHSVSHSGAVRELQAIYAFFAEGGTVIEGEARRQDGPLLPPEVSPASPGCGEELVAPAVQGSTAQSE